MQFKLRHNWYLIVLGTRKNTRPLPIGHNQAVQCLSSFLTHLTIEKNSACLLVFPFNSNVLKRMFIIKQITRKFVNISL